MGIVVSKNQKIQCCFLLTYRN